MSIKMVNGVPVSTEGDIVADLQIDDMGDPDIDPETGGYTEDAYDRLKRESDSEELVCQAEGCGEPLTYGGRGRKPKYCEIHKRSKSSTINPDRNAGQAKNRGFQGEATLRTALTSRYFALSGVVLLLTKNPSYALLIRSQVEECVEADIEYARTNLTFRKWLEGGVEKSAAASVVIAHAKMFGPIIMGENAKRATTAKAAPNVPQNGASQPNFRFPRPSPGPHSAANPTPKPATALYDPTTDDPPDIGGESINAGNIPGMPGF
jgi:hypothetical protein